MTISHIYKLAIELGIKHDLRGASVVRARLARLKEQYGKLSAEEKREFDRERLANPYSDSRYFGHRPDKPVRRILAGIDILPSEILLADRLSEKKPIDLVIGHHPNGKALAGLHEVMHMQAEIIAGYGVPINVAEKLLHLRVSEVSRSVSPINHNRTVDTANLLDVDLMCLHTPTDNMVASFLKRLIETSATRLEYVGDVLKLLKGIPEYQRAMELKAGPTLFAGSADHFAGRIAVTEVTGGTEGSKDMYERLAQAGVGTVIGMHMSEEHKKSAEKANINAIIAGHMSSDSLGLNLFLDELEQRGIDILPCSGFIRVSRLRRTSPAQRAGRVKKKK